MDGMGFRIDHVEHSKQNWFVSGWVQLLEIFFKFVLCTLTGWWFKICFLVPPIWERCEKIDEHIFQMGWFNHQPDNDPWNVKHTIDGRNPATVEMYKALWILGEPTNLHWLAGFLSHQQYGPTCQVSIFSNVSVNHVDTSLQRSS